MTRPTLHHSSTKHTWTLPISANIFGLLQTPIWTALFHGVSFHLAHLTTAQVKDVILIICRPELSSLDKHNELVSSCRHCIPLGGGGYSQKKWVGCAAHFPKPLPYLWPISAIFPTLFMTWLKIRNPVFDQRYNKFSSSNQC